jgi:hypothetical protein
MTLQDSNQNEVSKVKKARAEVGLEPWTSESVVCHSMLLAIEV